MRKLYLKDKVGEPRELEDISWQFGCNLTCAGWRELPEYSDQNGTMYELGHSRIYLDNIGVFHYRLIPGCGWARRFGQSFDEMRALGDNLLLGSYNQGPFVLGLLTGKEYPHDLFPLVR